MASDVKRARSVVKALCEKVILPLTFDGWQYYASRAHKMIFGDGPRRLMSGLDQQAVRTLLPACDIHRSVPDRSEL